MKNKIIMVLLLVVVLFFLAPININAATLISSGTEGDYGYSIYQNQDGTSYARLTKYIGTDTEVVIPSSIAGVSVTELYNTFYNNTSITKVNIPEGVISIGACTFAWCSNLTSITIPESVISIGAGSFQSCSSLNEITIPKNITDIGQYAFYSCSSLTNMIIPKEVISIGKYAFALCSNLTSTIILENVTNIGEDAFLGCESLTNIAITSNITNISNGTFAGCSNLTDVKLPNTITNIGDFAFQSCNSLTNIIIPENVIGIGKYAFDDCSSLTSITIPENVMDIGERAFFRCNDLVNVKLPEGIECISEYTFYGCTNLKNVNIPEKLISIGEYAFSKCNNLINITIPEGVEYIHCGVFYGWTDIQTINFETDSLGRWWNENWNYGCNAKINYGIYLIKSLSINNNIEFIDGNIKKIEVEILPQNAKNKQLFYESSDVSVATVDSAGKVTAIGAGTCKIIATTTDGTNLSATCNVVVKALPFKDVNKTKWYYDAVLYCYSNNIILGTSSTTFEPNTKLTRGMLATILYRMEGAPKITTENKFSDVQSGKYYYNAVLWAKKNGIVNGYSGTTRFGPNDNLTRQDLAVILSAYCNYKKKYVASNYGLTKYSDSSKISSYALPAMRWTVKNKIINGSNGNLNPKGTATRAEVATMLYSYCTNIK